MLYLALSCLQGRPMQWAAEELLELGAVGLQLTPGNVPTPNFWQWLQDYQVDSRTHHGFHYRALKCKVWNENAECLPKSHSVHPPPLTDSMVEVWRKKLAAGAYSHILLETMYPGYCLGDGEEIARAMAMEVKLAVDVSHIYMQLCQGSLSPQIWRRLQDYEQIGELHLSANNGQADIHQPLTDRSFGLDWVRERAADGTPVILECYMHRLGDRQRKQQLDLVVG